MVDERRDSRDPKKLAIKLYIQQLFVIICPLLIYSDPASSSDPDQQLLWGYEGEKEENDIPGLLTFPELNWIKSNSAQGCLVDNITLRDGVAIVCSSIGKITYI